MRIHRDGVALAYEDAGVGQPPMLLVHGWGTDRTVMKPLFEWARGSRRTVAVDLRGFGESDAPDQPYRIEGYSDDLACVSSTLGLGRSIVVGHSMGGMVALDFAARHADHVSAAIILEGMILAPDLLEGLRPILAGVRTDGYRNVVGSVMSYLSGPGFDAQERARLVARAASCQQHVLVSAMEGMLAFDSTAAASAVKCPLLYVGTGERYADLGRLRHLCPQVITGQLVGCGHYFPLEVPEQLYPMITRFIQSTARPSAPPPPTTPPVSNLE
jgi:pimeloyl-ACP methyl ester carboxylesterase